MYVHSLSEVYRCTEPIISIIKLFLLFILLFYTIIGDLAWFSGV